VYFELSALFFCRYYLENHKNLSKYQDFFITIGGPFTSFLVTVFCGMLWIKSAGADPWSGLVIIYLLNFLNTIIPHPYPSWQGAQGGIPSDGLQLVQLLRHERSGV
jgi:hypothetical protein